MKQALLALATGLAATEVAVAEGPVKEDGRWRSSLGAAYSEARGNSESLNLALQADAVRATPQDKWTAAVRALYARTDGSTTSDQLRAATRYDWNLTPRSFVFGGLELERDEVALLDLRASVSTGAGYKLVDDAALTWAVFGGVGYTGDRYAEPRLVDDALRGRYEYANLLVGQESTHRFSDTTSGRQRLALYPNLRNSGEYRADWDIGLAVAMTKSWNITAGFTWRYNSDPGPALRRTDTLLTTGVSVKFD